MATDIHSKRVSPSKLELELICPMSSEFFSAQENDEPGAEALYGSQVHLLGETIIRNALNLSEFDEKTKSVDEVIKELDLYDDEMDRLANLYAKSVIKDIEYEKKRTGVEPLILIETTLDLSYLIPNKECEMIGTLDFGYISNDTLVIEDLKTGRIIKKAGTRHDDGSFELLPQLGAYCSGVLYHYGSLYPIRNIRFVIHQERMNSVSEMELTIDEFKNWESSVLKPGIERLFDKDLKAVPNKMCKWCPGKGSCLKRAEENLSIIDKKIEPSLMSDKQIEELLPKLDDISKFVEDVKEQAIKRLHNGHKFKGFKLVYGSTKRTFTDSEKVAEILLANGYQAYSKPKILGITEVQRQLGKQKMTELLGSLITISNGTETIVPIDDPREEIKPSENKEK